MIADVKTSPLNYPLSDVELTNQCKAIFGGVSWPSKSPGFAIVLGMLYERHFDSHDIYLLEEYETFDTRELVRRCGAMDARYKPTAWFGDARNNAADKLIKELDSELQSPATSLVLRRSFWVCPTMMVEMKPLYAYILPHLKRLLDPERRMLFLKDSKIVNYLAAIEESDIAGLPFGEYPAIEALAFAVLEMKEQYPDVRPILLGQERDDDANDFANSYAVKTAFK